MTLKLDELLIKLDDFKNFRDISTNTDADRLNAFIRESQLKEIRDFLGSGLYFALISDYTADVDEGTFTEQRFTDLWFGATYTVNGFEIQFYGLKAAHVYFSYDRYLYFQKLNVTRYGSRVLEDNDLSENIPVTRKYEISSDSMGLLYRNDADKFINEKISTYPEFENPNKVPLQQTGWKFQKIGTTIGR